MFLVKLAAGGEIVSFGERPLPFTGFQFGNLIITDEELLEDLAEAPRCDIVLVAFQCDHGSGSGTDLSGM